MMLRINMQIEGNLPGSDKYCVYFLQKGGFFLSEMQVL